MPSNNVGGVSVSVRLDDKDALNQLNNLKRKIVNLNAELAGKRAVKTQLEQQLESITKRAEELTAKYGQIYRQSLTVAPADRAALNAQLRDLGQQLSVTTQEQERVQGNLQKITSEIAVGEQRLQVMGGAAENLSQQVQNSEGAMSRLKDAAARAAERMTKAFQRLGRMIRRVFVFTVILRALRALREYLSNLFLSFPEIRSALAEIKGNLLTAAQPIMERLIPAVTTLLNILVQVSAVLADIVSKIFGTTAAASRESAKALYDQAKAYKATGGAAQKASKQLASFDELNILNENKSGSGSSSGIEPDFTGGDITQQIQDKIGALELLVGEALLVIGAILTFTGVSIPLGVALMALGAASIVAAAHLDWDELKRQLQGPIGKIFALVSGAALVLGAILTFTGANLPLGIALMAIGAAGLVTAAAANWDKIVQALRGPIGKIVALASIALLALGLILTLSGAAIPLGIALIIAGAAGLGTVIGLNWDKIVQALRGPIGKIVALVSGALLVLGAILTFSGVNIPLGIALMMAGAAGLATVATLNWDKIKAILTGEFAGIMALASAGLLVLGIILTIAGFLPLGIALIVAGAAGLVTIAALDWDAIKQKIVDIWDSITSWWRLTIAPIFTKEWWANLFDSIRQGLLGKVAEAIRSAEDALTAFFGWTAQQKVGTTVNETGSSHSSGTFGVPALAAGKVTPTSGAFKQSVEAATVDPVAAIEQLMASGSSAVDQNLNVNLYLDGEKIANNTIKHINQAARAGGT